MNIRTGRTALYALGFLPAVWISLARILLIGFTFGSMSTILFSLAGAVLSLTVMWICRRFSLVDMVGASILGGVFHNIGQFLVAAYVVRTFGVFSYMPVLLFAGTAAGGVIGLLGGMILKRLRTALKDLER